MKNKFLFLFLTCLILGGCAVSNHNMYCQSDINCSAGFSCRSKKGGGTECRARPDEHTMSCQSDIDCSAGFSCRSKTGGGTECRATQSTVKVTQRPPENLMRPSEEVNSTPAIATTKSIEEAKETCSELGLKKGTEKFGKCVLRLSK